MKVFARHESKVRSYSNSFPTIFTVAKGCWLYDDQGKRYLDFLAGAGALNYGHNHPVLKKALMEYIDADGLTHGLDMHSSAKQAFLNVFNQIILKPRGLEYKVQFTGPTGTNAVEAALKLARKVKGRSNIVTFTNGFHGCTASALSATGNQHHRGAAGMTMGGISRMPYEGYADIDGLTLLETMLNDNSSGLDLPAAVLVEVVQGEGGLNAASAPWLQRLASICKQHDMLLIVDDIQAGCGRTGTFFSFESMGIQPDIVTLSKSIGGYGLPMAIVLLKPELDVWLPGEHNGTFRGNNHAFVTATAAIETFWQTPEFEVHIEERAKQIDAVLQQALADHPSLFVRIKGRGLMQGIECANEEFAEHIARQCFELGLIIETAGPNDEVIKFFAPLTITEEEMAQGLAIFSESVDLVAAKQASSEPEVAEEAEE